MRGDDGVVEESIDGARHHRPADSAAANLDLLLCSLLTSKKEKIKNKCGGGDEKDRDQQQMLWLSAGDDAFASMLCSSRVEGRGGGRGGGASCVAGGIARACWGHEHLLSRRSPQTRLTPPAAAEATASLPAFRGRTAPAWPLHGHEAPKCGALRSPASSQTWRDIALRVLGRFHARAERSICRALERGRCIGGAYPSFLGGCRDLRFNAYGTKIPIEAAYFHDVDPRIGLGWVSRGLAVCRTVEGR